MDRKAEFKVGDMVRARFARATVGRVVDVNADTISVLVLQGVGQGTADWSDDDILVERDRVSTADWSDDEE